MGAGFVGLLLGDLLRAKGIECIMVTHAAVNYVLGRIHAGILERITTQHHSAGVTQIDQPALP
jgi:p-hydroxybenzoate 3-monooxygenase